MIRVTQDLNPCRSVACSWSMAENTLMNPSCMTSKADSSAYIADSTLHTLQGRRVCIWFPKLPSFRLYILLLVLRHSFFFCHVII